MRPDNVLICVLWLLGAPAAAAAPSSGVFRCGPDTAIRYQDVPCAAGEPGGAWHPARRDPAGPVLQAPKPSHDAASRPPPRRRAKRMPPPARVILIPLQRDPSGCERARRARDRALPGDRRASYLLRRRWDDRVWEACR